MKELQRTVSFWAYNDVLKSGSSKKIVMQQDLVRKKYFGDSNDDDSMGYAEQLVKGLSAFSHMFDHEDDLTGRGGPPRLVMKEAYHCCPNTVIVSSNNPSDEGINLAVLSSKALKNRSQISAENIFKNAKTVEQNGKKALAIIARSEYKDGNMPSGKTFDDYLFFLREAMHKELHCPTSGSSEGGDESSSVGGGNASDSESPPGAPKVHGGKSSGTKEGHYDPFPGYIAFSLWGPIVSDESAKQYKAEAFWSADEPSNDNGSNGNKKSKTAGGRAMIRLSESQQNRKTAANKTDDSTDSRSGGGTGNDGRRGKDQNKPPQKKDILFAAFVAQQQTSSTKKEMSHHNKMLFNHYTTKIKVCQKEVKEWKSLITPDLLIMTDNPNSVYVMEELKRANENLRQAVREMDEFMSTIRASTIQDNTELESQKVYMKVVNETLLTGAAIRQPDVTIDDGSPGPHGDEEKGDRSSITNSSKRQRLNGTPCSSINVPNEWWKSRDTEVESPLDLQDDS